MSDSIQQDIYKIIASNTSVDPATITPESKLQDLGVDSLEAIEILFEVEEHFDIHMPDRDPNFDTTSVQGLIDTVQATLAAKAADAGTAATA